MTESKVPLFDPGRILMTPGAVEAMQECGVKPSGLLFRHLTGDDGELDEEDKRANKRALQQPPLRVFSSYNLSAAHTVWVITEWDRSVTTLLLPSEY